MANYKVLFTMVVDSKGQPRREGEVLEEDEIDELDRQLDIEAVEETDEESTRSKEAQVKADQLAKKKAAREEAEKAAEKPPQKPAEKPPTKGEPDQRANQVAGGEPGRGDAATTTGNMGLAEKESKKNK